MSFLSERTTAEALSRLLFLPFAGDVVAIKTPRESFVTFVNHLIHLWIEYSLGLVGGGGERMDKKGYSIVFLGGLGCFFFLALYDGKREAVFVCAGMLLQVIYTAPPFSFRVVTCFPDVPAPLDVLA